MRLFLGICLVIAALAGLAYIHPLLVPAIALPFLTVVAAIALFDILRKERRP